jgi:CO/xanthine dehydrogenase Mo-binding subunit
VTRACAIHVGQVAVVKRLRSIVRADGRRLEVGAVHAIMGKPGNWRADTDDGPRWVWLATETLAGAARRLGMWPDTLERRLLASGAPLPPKPAGKRHWRIPSETIERAASRC